jgi:tetratricopeptide (TPR) repeat protein
MFLCVVVYRYDCFALDQHECQLPDPGKPPKTSEWWTETFQAAIGRIGRTVMMLSPWNDPVPLTRAWCLWELYCTHAVGAEFRVCLGPDERRAFEAALVRDGNVLCDTFANIDVKNAKAGMAADQAMILGAVQTVGFEVLNAVAFDHMRNWTVGVARGLLQRTDLGVGGRNNIGSLFRQLGFQTEALRVHEGTLARPDAEQDEEFAQTLTHIAAIYVAQSREKFGSALELCQRALDISVRAKGEAHPDVANVLVLISAIYRAQSNTAQAMELLQRALDIYLRAKGDTHPDVASTLLAIANVYLKQSEFGWAIDFYQRALDIYVKLHGETHGSVATTLSNMASVYCKQSQPGQALELYMRSLHIYVQVYGEASPSVATVLYNMAVLAKSQGASFKAKELFLRSAVCYEQVYGADHAKTILARKQADQATKRQSKQRLGTLEISTGDVVSTLISALTAAPF